ncbi:unnamed protein product [Durusdinium trenchii]|uniref:Uncharacterized protein n=2 Tax=Durusdinium trenchii TaxID=1381693 RepID=A0ABP0RUR4_9DINO
MVVPLPANESITALPDGGQPMLVLIRYAVVGLWVFSIFLVIISPLSALSQLGMAWLGTYLLAEDPQMSPCYARLRATALGQCCGDGGLRMLFPFFLLGAVNCLVDGATLIQIFSVNGWGSFKIVAVDALLGVFTFEFLGALASWRLVKMVIPMGGFADNGALDGYRELPGAPGRPLGGPGPGGITGAGAPPGAGSTDAFKPFQGTGHKLGS